MKIRSFWLALHRYVGLAMTIFLIVVGLTGSLLAFLPELDHALAPQFHVPDHGAQARSDAATLLEQAEARIPLARADAIWMGEVDLVQISMSARITPSDGKPVDLSFDQLLLNPYTGEELGRRHWGVISEGLHNLMPFVYKLHYNLALDDIGGTVLGIVALAWTLDSFVGFYLTLPTVRRSQSECERPAKAFKSRSFWSRWKPAWAVKWSASVTRINFDLHRAGGLWLWLALLVFAWSSVYMNLWESVYTPVTRALFDFHDPWSEVPKRDSPFEQPSIGWRQAQTLGDALLSKAGAEQGFHVERPISLRIDRDRGVYIYQVRSSRDIQDRNGETRVFFDANTGELRSLSLPRGQYTGNTVTSWLFALHKANVWGLPYRIFVCVLGLAIVMLSVTGVLIWLKKRRSKRAKSAPSS